MLPSDSDEQPTTEVELSRTVDALLPAYEAARERGGAVVSLGLWSRLPAACLFPFELYLRRPDALAGLSLHPRLLWAPLTGADDEWLGLPIYDPRPAREARKPIRLALQAAGSSSLSRTPSDWERALVLRSEKIPRTCPARSLLAVDVLGTDGEIERGSRPFVGRHAPRRGLRDRLLAVRRGPLSAANRSTLAVDFFWLNYQGIRGRRTRALMKDLLVHFRATPGVLITSSPSDLFDLSDGAWPSLGPVVPFGDAIPAPSVAVVRVGREREQLEREFEAATSGIAEFSTESAALLESGSNAWWSATRSITTDEAHEPAVARYLREVAALATRSPVDAGRFTSLTESILHVLHDDVRAYERRQAIRDAIETERGECVVLLPGGSARRELLRIEHGLERDGVRFATPREGWRERGAASLIVAGLVGSLTLDAVLKLRPQRATFIVDPVEARVAVALLQKWGRFLTNCGVRMDAIAQMTAQLETVAAVPLALREAPVAVNWTSTIASGGDDMMSDVDTHPDEQLVRVHFIDGTNFVCSRSRRFDVLVGRGGNYKSREARELQPGDELIIVASGDAQAFSEKLIEGLDKTVLAQFVERRRAWRTLTRAVVEQRKMSVPDIAREMKARGVSISTNAIRGWVRGTDDRAATANRSFESFRCFVDVLGLRLDEQAERGYWDAIRTVRTRHRLAGRQLVRAIRAAAAGRLSHGTLVQIQRNFGLDARRLVDASRLAVVDDVEEVARD